MLHPSSSIDCPHMRTQVKYLLHSDCQVSISAKAFQPSRHGKPPVQICYMSGQQPAAKLVGSDSLVRTTVCASVRKKAALYFFTQDQGLNWEILTNTKCCPQSKSDCGPLLLKGLTGEAILLHWKALTGKCNSVSTLRHSGQPFTWFHQSGTVYSTPVPPSSTSHTLYFQFGLYHPCCSRF